MTKTIAILGLGLALVAGMLRPAGAAWQVDERGDCSRVWTADSLLHGPKALANAPLVPFRAAVGAFQMVPEFWKAAVVPSGVLTVPLLVGGSIIGGLAETIVWGLAGIADTVTGGYFDIAPDRATELSVTPVRPLFLPDAPKPVTQDRCGRPLK